MKPPHRIRSLAPIAWIAFFAFPTAPAAQDTDAGLREAIEANAELLVEATALVRTTNSTKARAALDAARKLHEVSLSQLTAGNRLMAGQAAKEAREAILRAISIARREAMLEEGALRAMEQAATRLEQARAALVDFGGPDDSPARKLAGEAHEQLLRAQNNMREHMFEVALQLANASSELSERVIRMLRRDAVTPELVRREVARTNDIIARAEKHRDVARALDEAKDLQERAKQNASGERWRLALEQTQRARDLALRILKSIAPVAPSRDDVARALEFTDELIDRAREIARGDGVDAEVDKVEEARRLQERARRQFEQDQPGEAMALTMRSREVAKTALRAMEKPIDREGVRAALERTDDILGRLRAALATAPDPAAQALLDRATERQADARKAFDADELRKALALTRVAGNLGVKALGQLGKDDE